MLGNRLTPGRLAEACRLFSEYEGPHKQSTCTQGTCDTQNCTSCPACRVRAGKTLSDGLDERRVRQVLGLKEPKEKAKKA